MAITLDATSSGLEAAGSSLTFSHTVGSGSNGLLVVLASTTLNPNTVSGITFNGDSMTLVDSQDNSAPNKTGYIYYLLNPDSGTHDIVITATGSTTIIGEAVSFFGVKQTGPDATYKGSNTGTSTTSTLTTTTDNSVHTMVAVANAYSPDGDTNGTPINLGYGGYYSDPLLVTPAGSHTITVTSSGGSNQWATVGAAWGPVPEPLGGFIFTSY